MKTHISIHLQDVTEITAKATAYETPGSPAFEAVVVDLDDTTVSIYAEPNGLVRLATALLGAIDKLPVREHDCGPLCREHGDPRDTNVDFTRLGLIEEAVAVG